MKLEVVVRQTMWCKDLFWLMRVCVALALVDPSPRVLLAAQPDSARDHGTPITTANRISYKTAYQFGVKKQDLLCWTTTAESGGHFSAMDLQSGTVWTHPLNHLEAYPIVFGSDGKVYVGSTSGEVVRWDPVADTWGPLGDPLFAFPEAKLNHVRVLCEGRDGWLYAGSCYGERARIHMRSGAIEELPETPEPGNWYVSAAAALPDGRIAFGYGHKARVFIYDPEQGKDIGQWMPEGYTADGFCFNLVSGSSVLYATHFPSGRRVGFDITTGRFLGKIPWPDDRSGQQWSTWAHSSGYGSAIDFYLIPGTDTVVTFDGEAVYLYDASAPAGLRHVLPGEFSPPPELALSLSYEVTSDCAVLKYNRLRDTVLSRIQPDQPKVARGLHGLGIGPDGRVYGGAYQSTLLFCYDPKAETTIMLGDHHPGWSGETFSYAARGGELICASYTNGAVVAYDPGREWQCERGGMINPRFLGFLGQTVYRPFSTCISDDGRVWCVGPAGWGSTGGGIGFVDPQDSQTATVPFPDVPFDVLPLTRDQLFVCSDSLARWWDIGSNREIARAPLPARMVSASMVPHESRARLVLASQDELFVCDASIPGKLSILRRWESPLPCSRAIIWKGRAIVGGPKGFASLDLQTGRSQHFCLTPLGNRWAFVATGGRLYFHNGAHLLSARIPGQP